MTKALIVLAALLVGVYLILRKALVPITLLGVIYLLVWHALPQLALLRHVL